MSASVPRDGRKFPKPSSRDAGQRGASLHMRGKRGGGERGRGAPVWRRSITLVLAAILGYIGPNVASTAFATLAGHGADTCSMLAGEDGLGLGEPGEDASRSVAGVGSLGHQRSPRAGSTAHEAGHVSASVQSGAGSPGQDKGRAAEHLFRSRMAQSKLAYISTFENLRDVWREFLARSGKKSSAGVDWVTPVQFQQDLHKRLSDISTEMRTGYTFSPLRGVVLPKKDAGKTRLICVPTIADRLVQRAVLRLIEVRAEKLGIVNDVSFGFVRPLGDGKRGTHAAQAAAVKLRKEFPWVLKADIAAFFDTIDRKQLVEEWGRKFRLTSLQPLVFGAINCEVRSDSDRVRASIAQNKIRPGRGLRQGMPLSPILSNFVLKDFDGVVGQHRPMVRYADDMLVFASSLAECHEAQALVAIELGKLGLELSTTKTRRHAPDEAVEFPWNGARPEAGQRLCLDRLDTTAGSNPGLVHFAPRLEGIPPSRHDGGGPVSPTGADEARLSCRLRRRRQQAGARRKG